MSDAVLITLIGTIGTFLTAIATLIINIKIKAKQAQIHEQINGMQGKLITAEKSTSNLEGQEEGRIKEINREKDK